MRFSFVALAVLGLTLIQAAPADLEKRASGCSGGDLVIGAHGQVNCGLCTVTNTSDQQQVMYANDNAPALTQCKRINYCFQKFNFQYCGDYEYPCKKGLC
ncbi:hypothetical protein BC939DRAFT_434092 [Gamsiella multidivaricata]|uniref:uncharacterized protein n=1 Tax=Gamsiella multidivaricata TaxID=101098 RepID=UPI00221FE7A1|nr:uncharacterized protein BC939DRAFT_434092 [Gamsiella multidivaricata]KAG0360106.1 hypothetical protein BGZ54_009699 [Gamsiella multidivaricata]KAI7832696.1 hypothetical protein BC939DRAFT_434092 [Gamsiella multidivaricata]